MALQAALARVEGGLVALRAMPSVEEAIGAASAAVGEGAGAAVGEGLGAAVGEGAGAAVGEGAGAAVGEGGGAAAQAGARGADSGDGGKEGACHDVSGRQGAGGMEAAEGVAGTTGTEGPERTGGAAGPDDGPSDDAPAGGDAEALRGQRGRRQPIVRAMHRHRHTNLLSGALPVLRDTCAR
eukprot:221359-Prymnesium_polylepis.1